MSSDPEYTHSPDTTLPPTVGNKLDKKVHTNSSQMDKGRNSKCNPCCTKIVWGKFLIQLFTKVAFTLLSLEGCNDLLLNAVGMAPG